MTALEQALRTALLHFVWQGVVVSFLLWTALFFLRKRSANARYIASCIALIVLLALPVITACAVYTQPVVKHSTARFFAAVPQTVAAAWTGPVGSAPTGSISLWMSSLGWWALPAWAFGVILFSFRLAWGAREVAVLRRSGTPADPSLRALGAALAARLGIERPVRLLITSLAEGPSVVGWIRPVILLPAATLMGLTPEQLEAVLAHEFAHIRRYDYLVNIFQMVVETLLFYHPAVWWTSARIRHERELCCDDLAVSMCGDPLCYARALTKLERLRTLAPNMAMGGTGGSLLYRIQRLTGSAGRRFGPSRLPGILAVCIALLCIALCTTWTRAHAQELKPHPAPKAVAAPTPAVVDAPGVRVELGGATVLVREPVRYPLAALDDDIEGRVEVEATLDGSGKVKDARVLSGPEELRDAVLASVRKWNFKSGAANTPLRFSIAFQAPEVEPDSDDDDHDVDVHVDVDNDVDVDVDVDVDTDMDVDVDTDVDTDVDVDVDVDSDVEVSVPENSMSELENSLSEAESAIEEAESELRDKFADLTSQVDDAQHELEKLGKLEEHVSLMEGRTLKRVHTIGISDQTRTELLKRLPVHEGDKLTKDLIAKLEKSVHEFDSHLSCFAIPLEDTQATILIGRK